MGSDNRFDYTAMGDTVNLGSRLEGVTKKYGVPMIISETTKAQIGDGFILRELDFVAVKGKEKPIKIYELMVQKDDSLIENYEKGLNEYRKRDWDRAIGFFTKNPEDKASKIFTQRCEEYKKNPPAEDWDMVWRLKEK